MSPEQRMHDLRKMLAGNPALFQVEHLYDTLIIAESTRDYWHREATRLRQESEQNDE